MTPSELDDLLAVLRKHNVASCVIPTTRGTLQIALEPNLGEPLPGSAPTPGGWKSPERLDSMTQFDEPRAEAP